MTTDKLPQAAILSTAFAQGAIEINVLGGGQQ
jgi:hypothetical protein